MDKLIKRPGDVRVSKGSFILGLGVWAKKDESGTIHIHLTGDRKFHTTITDKPDSVRYHRTLFRNLQRMLEQHGVWPY